MPKSVKYLVSESTFGVPYGADKENNIPRNTQPQTENQVISKGSKGEQLQEGSQVTSYDARKEIARLLKVLDHRDDEIQSLSNTNSQRENELSRLRKILEEYEQEIEKFKLAGSKPVPADDKIILPHFGISNPDSSEQESQRNLFDEIEELNKTIQARDDDLGKLATHIKEQNIVLEASTSELKNQRAISDKLGSELKNEKKKYLDLCLKLEFQESKLRQLEIELAESKEKISDQSNLLGSGFNNPVELKNFFESNRSDVIAQDRIKDLEQNVHHLESVIANLNHKLKNPQGQISGAVDGLNTIDLLSSKLQQEKTLKEELEGKLKNLEEKIEQVIQAGNKGIDQDQLLSLQRDFDQLRSDNSELEVQLTEKNARIEDMDQEIEILRHKGLQEEMLSAELSEKLMIAVDQTKNLAEDNQMLTEEKNGVQEELQKSIKAIEELTKERDTLKTKLATLVDELKLLKQNSIKEESTQNALSDKDDEIESLNS